MFSRLAAVAFLLSVTPVTVNAAPLLLKYTPYPGGTEVWVLTNPVIEIHHSFFVLADELIYQVAYVSDDLSHPAANLGSIENRYEQLKLRLWGKVFDEFPILSLIKTWVLAQGMLSVGLPPIPVLPHVTNPNPLAPPAYIIPTATSQPMSVANSADLLTYQSLSILIMTTINDRILPLYPGFTECVKSTRSPGGMLELAENLEKCRDGFAAVLDVISLFQSRMALEGLLSPSDQQMFDAWKDFLREKIDQVLSGFHQQQN